MAIYGHRIVVVLKFICLKQEIGKIFGLRYVLLHVQILVSKEMRMNIAKNVSRLAFQERIQNAIVLVLQPSEINKVSVRFSRCVSIEIHLKRVKFQRIIDLRPILQETIKLLFQEK